MYKKAFIFLTLLSLTSNSAFSGDLFLKVSPVHKLSTSTKNIFEGDEVSFKISQNTGEFNKDEIITGTIIKYKPNGFNGDEANLTIGNFKRENGKTINGELYISGNMHKVYQDYVNITNSTLFTIPLIRGGEINIKPNETVTLIVKNKTSKSEIIPIKIKPSKKITTCHDETQTGDILKFKTIKDVYTNNELFIKKNSPVIGYVDYVQDNGWQYDNAQIDIKKFKTRDINGNLIEINSLLEINGFELLKYKSNRPAQFFNYIGSYFRGKEVEIEPEKDTNVIFNIWLVK